MKRKKKTLPKPHSEINREGWYAIRHIDGWWIGNDKGVLCYEEYALARMVLTVRWQMDGGGRLQYRIARYHGEATLKIGRHESKKTAEQAIKDYENETA